MLKKITLFCVLFSFTLQIIATSVIKYSLLPKTVETNSFKEFNYVLKISSLNSILQNSEGKKDTTMQNVVLSNFGRIINNSKKYRYKFTSKNIEKKNFYLGSISIQRELVVCSFKIIEQYGDLWIDKFTNKNKSRVLIK